MSADGSGATRTLILAGVLALVLTWWTGGSSPEPMSAPEPGPAPEARAAPEAAPVRIAREAVVLRGSTVDSVRVSLPAPEGWRAAGECTQAPDHPLASQGTRLVMVWGPADRRERRVMVMLDPMGELHRYSDLRGAFLKHDPRGQPGPGTAIHLDFEDGHALVRDQDPTGEISNLMLNLMEAAEAPALGPPAAVIEHVVNRCGLSSPTG